MVFNTTFNNICVILWGTVYWWKKLEYPEKTTNLPQVTDKLYHIILHQVLTETFEEKKYLLGKLNLSFFLTDNIRIFRSLWLELPIFPLSLSCICREPKNKLDVHCIYTIWTFFKFFLYKYHQHIFLSVDINPML